MSLVFLSLAIAALWINLVGVGLASQRFIRDYALARVAGVLGVCLLCFFAEYFVGFGPRLSLLPATTAASLWIIWRRRSELRAYLPAEGLFAVGFFYCLAWRYAFPDINFTEDKMPNFGFIEAYMRGTRLPPPDLWLAPYRANCYYSFQHYGAALMGRLLGVGPGVSYHLAFCAMVGLLTLLMGSFFAKVCAWRPGRWIGMASLLLGGSGVAIAAHFLVKEPYVIDVVRFLGGSIVRNQLTPLGQHVSNLMAIPGVQARDLPMEPLSYFLTKGDFHPPLAGFLLLAFAAVLIVAQEGGASGRSRSVYHALLAATVPLALISNAWILPLQLLLVSGWFAFCLLRGERGCLKPAALGFAAAILLEYPFLLEFTQQSIGENAAIHLTSGEDHTPLLGWVLIFWPVLGIMALSLLERERRPLVLFFLVIWATALFGSEFFYNHDLYGGPWGRFNSTLKWWQWVYAGIMLTLGAINLGSKSRICRYGTMLLLIHNLAFAYDLGVEYFTAPKDSAGELSGSKWIERDPVIKTMIFELAHRPDGVAIESGLAMENTESPAISLFSGKQSFLGWPWLENVWRSGFMEVNLRFSQMNTFYAGELPDPLGWLLHNNIRYVLWLPRDNGDHNSRFARIQEKIKSRYFWHHLYGNDQDFSVGFWERIDGP